MRAQACKVLKEVQGKIQDEVTAHKHSMDALTIHINTEAKEQQQWFKNQLASPPNVTKQIEHILKDQIANRTARSSSLSGPLVVD